MCCILWGEDLMNRLIHRSWGEGFANIFLDLCIYISTFPHHRTRDLGSGQTCYGESLDQHSACQGQKSKGGGR